MIYSVCTLQRAAHFLRSRALETKSRKAGTKPLKGTSRKFLALVEPPEGTPQTETRLRLN